MSAAQANNPASTSTWTEPPWSGWIETTGDALLILEAARRGLIPRVTRRLVDSERKMITSGSVFVFDEDESGIKRWTDGFFWSPSRILGNFLLYRETDKRGAGHRGARSDLSSSDINEQSQYNLDGVKLEGRTLSRPKTDGGQMGVDKHRERTLMGSLTNSYKFKPDGLMKKTFSLTIGGVSQHLISYYKIEDVENGRLRSPSSLPELASLDISPEYLDKTHFRNPPKVEIGVDGLPRYRGEADDIDTSPSLLSAPLSSGLPLLSESRAAEEPSANRRGKRFDPYSTPSAPKKTRRNTKTTAADASSPTDQAAPQTAGPSAGFPDPNVAMVSPPHYHPPYGTTGFYQVPGYPGSAATHPHMYSSPPYPPPGNGSPQPAPPLPHGSGPPPSQYHYTAYATVPGADPVQTGQSGQQPYYPYPPTAYPPGYSGAAWPHFPTYPPQPMPHQSQPSLAADGEKQPNDSADGDGDDS